MSRGYTPTAANPLKNLVEKLSLKFARRPSRKETDFLINGEETKNSPTFSEKLRRAREYVKYKEPYRYISANWDGQWMFKR